MSKVRNPLYSLGQLKKIIKKYEDAGVDPDDVAVSIIASDTVYFEPNIEQYEDQFGHYFGLEINSEK